MHDPTRHAVGQHQGVGVVQGARGFARDEHRHGWRHRAVTPAHRAHDGRQILPDHVLHHHEVRAVDVAEVVDLDDVRVIEQRGDARLLAKRLHELRRVGFVGADALHDEDALEPLHALRDRAEHLRHAPRADSLEKLIAAKRVAGPQRPRRLRHLVGRRGRHDITGSGVERA